MTPPPFPRIPYDEALLALRHRTSRTCATRFASPTSPRRSAAPASASSPSRSEQGGIVRAIPAPGAAAQPRSFFDKLNDWAREQGAAGSRLHRLRGRRTQGTDRQEPGRGAAGGDPHGRRRQGRRCRVLRLRQEGGGREVRRRRAQPARRRSSTSARRTPSASAGSSTSRCMS